MEAQSNALQNKLQSNLERRRIDLSKQLESFTQSDTLQGGRFLTAKRSELSTIEASIDALTRRLRGTIPNA